MDAELGVVVDYVIQMVLRAPHLYLLTVVYWGLVAAVLVSRYVLKRRRVSELCMRALVVLGCAAIALAAVDVAVRGQELIQISLVAYFATPLGVGRYFVRKWDGCAVSGWRGVAIREVTYVLAFLSFVVLSVLDGDPWWFSRPELDRTSVLTIIENTNWLQFMATVFGLTALVEAVGLSGSLHKWETARKKD